MKELHNHIFSNTTCISKEIMLRYINKQLSKNELYEVEKHMLDCELCSDAYEGMQFATNSSVLFAIDSQIDQRVATGNSKAPIMRSLMVAASILVIVFGAYFTFDFFNTSIGNDSGLAINEVKESNQEQPFEEKMKSKDLEINNQEILDEETKLIGNIAEEGEKYNVEKNAAVPILAEQTPNKDRVVVYDMEDEEVLEEEIIVADVTEERVNKAKGESGKQVNSSGDANNSEADNRRADDFTTTIQTESSTANNSMNGAASNESQIEKSGESLKKEGKMNKPKTSSKVDKKRRFKTANEAPAYAETVPIEAADKLRDRNQDNVLIINGYKAVDYMDEFQKEYDLKNTDKVTTKSVSAGFESKTDEDVAEKEKEESIVEITYKETLEAAIKLYKNGKYVKAITEFNIILKEHPEEVNGLFYSGMSYYQLKQYTLAKDKLNLVLKNKETEFNPEANWYKALTLVELKQADKAKRLLKEIIKANGFYKTAATEKLKGL